MNSKEKEYSINFLLKTLLEQRYSPQFNDTLTSISNSFCVDEGSCEIADCKSHWLKELETLENEIENNFIKSDI